MRALEQALHDIKPLDEKAMAAARSRQNTLTKPLGSLGRLEELSIKLAGIKGKPIPRINRTAIVTMAADHGIVAEGVSAYPQAVTPQMVLNFLHGGAGINVLARHVGAKVIVVDMGVASDGAIELLCLAGITNTLKQLVTWELPLRTERKRIELSIILRERSTHG